MMLRQDDRGAQRAIDPIVDGGYLSELQGGNGGMDDRSVQALIVGSAARRSGNYHPIATEGLKRLIVDVNLEHERAVHALQGELVERDILCDSLRSFQLDLGQRIADDLGLLLGHDATRSSSSSAFQSA